MTATGAADFAGVLGAVATGGFLTAVFTDLGGATILTGALTGALDLTGLTDLTGALAGIFAAGLTWVLTWVLTWGLAGVFTTGFTALAGLAGAFTTVATGLALAFTAAGTAALGRGLALTATFEGAFLATAFTDDLLDVFTSCLLAVQLTRTQCASPSHRTHGAHLHQNPGGGPPGAGGAPIRHPVRAAIVATGQVKSWNDAY